jgi:aminoglycoside 6'-N-acetyltransferase I
MSGSNETRPWIEIRPAAPSDAVEWLKMRCDLWPDGAEEHGSEIADFFAGALSEPLAVFVVLSSDGHYVGLLELSIREDVPTMEGKRTGYIEGLYVIPEMRSRGVAFALLERARLWARSLDCTAFASDRADRFVIDRRFNRR